MVFHNRHITNTFGLEAVADTYIEYRSGDELRRDLPQAKEPFLHVGGGSNLLFLQPRFAGTVFHNAIDTVEIVSEDASVCLVRAGGGMIWDDFVAWCVTRGLYGAENLSLIPGEVGAAAVQNIGAYGAEAKDIIERVEAYDINGGVKVCLSCEECQYGYRSSLFKREEGRRYFVLSVVFRLSKVRRLNLEYGALKDLDKETATLQQVRQKVIEIRQEKLPDPERIGSAGSFFMNPVVPESKYEALAREYDGMPHYPAADGMVKLSAGWMIDRCGLKGAVRGRAGVYDRQALVLVNLGGATASEIMTLAEEVIAAVKEKFDVTLHPEVQIIKKG